MCSATRSAERSRRSSRGARPTVCGGSCCARRRPVWAGVPPRPMAALMLATPARYYHPRLLALSVPHIAGGRTARDPSCSPSTPARACARPPDVLGYAYQLYAAAGWSSLPWLHRVKQPTLVVAGDDDPSVPVLTRGSSPRGCPTRACTWSGRRSSLPARRTAQRVGEIRGVPGRPSVTGAQPWAQRSVRRG